MEEASKDDEINSAGEPTGSSTEDEWTRLVREWTFNKSCWEGPAHSGLFRKRPIPRSIAGSVGIFDPNLWKVWISFDYVWYKLVRVLAESRETRGKYGSTSSIEE